MPGLEQLSNLSSVMLKVLTIPHSSAHCERIFRIVIKNKTDFRGSPGKDTLEALVVAKARPGQAQSRRYSTEQLAQLAEGTQLSSWLS